VDNPRSPADAFPRRNVSIHRSAADIPGEYRVNHRQRVLTSLDHQSPDRCPMQISFTPEFARRLREQMRLQGRVSHNPHGAGNTYELELALDQDLLLTSVGWANSYYQSQDGYTDEWDIGWRPCTYQTPFGPGVYTEVVSHPLADDRAIDRYRAPDPARPELYMEAQKLLDHYKAEYFIVGVTVTTLFETAWALRGLSQLMIDFLTDPELAHRILDIPYQYHLAAAKRLVQMGVDMIWTGDDVAGQTGMMIAPSQWRTFLKPRMAQFIAELKAINPQIKVAYHSDGDIRAIIPELIEIGVDVLNPIQPACMDPAEIKREYGDRLSFWGTVDEQRTLPFGTPEDVRQEVRRRLETIGNGGGLILGPTHHVQMDTPLENFWAMVDTIRTGSR
jgi:uroporphyrinogen decarboxylase